MNFLTNKSVAKRYSVLAASPLTLAAVMVAKKGFYVPKKKNKKTRGTRNALNSTLQMNFDLWKQSQSSVAVSIIRY